jgi:hypothetical protein
VSYILFVVTGYSEVVTTRVETCVLDTADIIVCAVKLNLSFGTTNSSHLQGSNPRLGLRDP